LSRAHAPFDEIGELVALFAVRDRQRGGAAAERHRHAGGERATEGLLHQFHARVAATRGLHVGLLERNQIIEGRNEDLLLLQDDLDRRLVELEQMIGRVDAGIEAAEHALSPHRCGTRP